MTTFEQMKEEIDNYYTFNNFDSKDEYAIVFTKNEFKSLLKALKKYYVQQLFGRKICKKGYIINYLKLNIIED